jgi:apolipoprotein N-acyltransferase
MAEPRKAPVTPGTNLGASPFPMSDAVRISLSAASGFLLVAAYPSFHYYECSWISLIILMIALSGARPRTGALCGYVHGVAFFTPSLTWLYQTFRIHGGVGPFVSCVALGAIVAMASVFPMIFGWAFARVARHSFALACFGAPFLWVAQEFGRTNVPGIGFPWNLLGYTWSHNLAMAQLSSVGGVWILSFLAVLFSALVVWGVGERRGVAGKARRAPILIAVVITAILIVVAIYGDRWVPGAAPDHVARLVQSNFPEPDNFPADWMITHNGELDELQKLSTAPDKNGNPPGLVIWSEVPAPFSMQDPRFAFRAAAIARGTRDGFLVGVIDWKVSPGNPWRVYNSAALIDPSGNETFLYDKIRLVPFSEYLPYGKWFAFVRKITPEVGNFAQGTEWKVGTLPDGRRFSVFICYEAVFPGEVRQFVANGAELLVNISNDGWFGRSAAPEQHLDMARVRAIENRRWMIRCTNNGHTVSVDPYGREVASIPTDIRASLEAPYGYRDDMTVYARYGDWLPWLSLLASLGFVIIGYTARK